MNNDHVLSYVDTNFEQDIYNCDAVIYILVTQEIIDFSYRTINQPGLDSFNRNDQQCRAYCDFTVLELIDITDRRHPVPVDPLRLVFKLILRFM